MAPSLRPYLSELPLVAILRGLRPEDALAVGETLVAAGFRVIEVPLNSPEPFKSIEVLAKRLPAEILVGAGTVLRTDDVASVRDAGGRLIVMPHSDGDVIRRAKELDLVCTPGVATPTEAFAALRNGADGLKMFPAENLPPAVAKAWRAVLAPDTLLIPVGGITPETMKPYIAAGADGFGLGSALFAPDRTLNDIEERAQLFAESWRSTTGGAARAG
jgi:2-dehydro-3-deoxyphosphogalactonate aldolase